MEPTFQIHDIKDLDLKQRDKKTSSDKIGHKCDQINLDRTPLKILVPCPAGIL